MNQFTADGSVLGQGGGGWSPVPAPQSAPQSQTPDLFAYSQEAARRNSEGHSLSAQGAGQSAPATGWGGAPAAQPQRQAAAPQPQPAQPQPTQSQPAQPMAAQHPRPAAAQLNQPQQLQGAAVQPGAGQQPQRATAQPAAGQQTQTTAGRRPNVSATDSHGRIGMSQKRQEGDIALEDVLEKVLELGASDLHLTVGAPPMLRLAGSLQPIEGFPVLEKESLQRSIYLILTQKQREMFEDELELDFAYSLPNRARFRVNLYLQRESIGAAFRLIPYEIKPLEALGVPAVVGAFAGLPRGLVLVTGPTGSGKSTTLAAIIDLANRSRAEHIMTVEDPIEFLHKHKKALVNQREVGEDTKSFANALKHVLRQDPDIILVGEMRDLETISVALTAAETGHLVFATLHTQDAAQTIDRVIDVFPSHQQEQVRTQLASAIQGVVCQTLCKRSDAPGRVVATEVMVATPAIRNLIREGKTHQIYSAMQAGANQGMHTLDQHLADLVRVGKISYEAGLEKCHHIEDYNRLTGRTASAPQGQTTVGDGGLGY